MSFAPTLPRTPVSAKSVGLLLAAFALGTGSTIATVATASHASLPTVSSHASQQAPSTTDTQDSTDSSSNTSSSSNNANANAFGQQVVAQVRLCQASGPFNNHTQTHGIGKCVSTFVLQKNPGAAHHTH
jgi:guanyl-specific ribonuclease Sa